MSQIFFVLESSILEVELDGGAPCMRHLKVGWQLFLGSWVSVFLCVNGATELDAHPSIIMPTISYEISF